MLQKYQNIAVYLAKLLEPPVIRSQLETQMFNFPWKLQQHYENSVVNNCRMNVFIL